MKSLLVASFCIRQVQSVIVDRDEFKVLRWKPYMYVPCKLPPDEVRVRTKQDVEQKSGRASY